MTFLWPQMLWLLLTLPVLVLVYVWVLRRRKKMALRFANLPLVKQALGRRLAWRRHVPPVLLLAAVTVLIVAVARPAAVLTLDSARATVVLAIDVSGSMRAEDIEPTRIEAAQEAARRFVANQPAEVEIAVVAFAGRASLVQAPTTDRLALLAAINGLQLGPGTAVGGALLTSLATIFPDEPLDVGVGESMDERQALGALLNPPAQSRSLDDGAPPPRREQVEPGSYEHAVIILLTDGATNTGPSPRLAGLVAASYGVKVYTVGFGSADGDVVQFGGRTMRATFDARTLMLVAELTRGEYFEATSLESLSEVYDTLSARFVPEEKLTEIAFILAGIGALLALLSAALSMFWLGRIA